MTLDFYQDEINFYEHFRDIDSLFALFETSLLLGLWYQESELISDHPEITTSIRCIIDRYYRKIATQLESTERKDQNNEIL